MSVGKSAALLLKEADKLLYQMVHDPPRHYRVSSGADVNLEKLAGLKKEFTIFYLAFRELAPQQRKSGAVDTEAFTTDERDTWERILWQKSLMGIDLP